VDTAKTADFPVRVREFELAKQASMSLMISAFPVSIDPAFSTRSGHSRRKALKKVSIMVRG
jgi:hypothetical protein